MSSPRASPYEGDNGVGGTPAAMIIEDVNYNNNNNHETTTQTDQAATADALVLIRSFLEYQGLVKTAEALNVEVINKPGMMVPRISWNGGLATGFPIQPSLLPPDALLQALKAKTNTTITATTAIETTPSLLLNTHAMFLENAKTLIGTKACRALLEGNARVKRLIQEGNRRPLLLENALHDLIALRSRARLVVPFRARERGSLIDKLHARTVLMASVNNGEGAINVDLAMLEISRFHILKKIVAHHGPVYCLGLDEMGQDGGYEICTGADDYLVKVWTSTTGMLKASIRGHREVVTDVSVLPQFAPMTTTTSSLATTTTTTSTTNGVISAALPLVASASHDLSVRIFRRDTGRPVAVYMGHKKPVQRVEWIDGDRLVSVGDDGACLIWDVGLSRAQMRNADEAAAMRTQRELQARQLREKNQGSTTTTTTTTGQLPPYEELPKYTAAPPLCFPHVNHHQHAVEISSVAIHPSRKYLVTGSSDSLGRIWSLTGEVVTEPNVPKLPATIAATATTTTTTTTATTTPLDFISTPFIDGSHHLVCTLAGHSGSVHHVEWSKHGDRVLTYSDKDATARIWSWSNSTETSPFSSRPNQILLRALDQSTSSRDNKRPTRITAATFNCDDSMVVTTQSVRPASWESEHEAFWDARICLWESRTGQLLRFFRGHRSVVNVIRTHPHLAHVAATCGDDGLIIFWNLHSGKELTRLEAISHEGYAGVLDARWTDGKSSTCDFVATDSMGRLLLIGTGSTFLFDATPAQQFFEGETAPVVHDVQGLARDLAVQVPPHLMPVGRVVNFHGEEHVPQPNATEDRHVRVVAVREAERLMQIKEDEAREAARHLTDKMDRDIAEARRRDVAEYSDGGGGGDDGRRRKASSSKQTLSKRSNIVQLSSKRRRHDVGLLALERNGNTQQQNDSGEEEDEDLATEEQATTGRLRRSAARRANAQILRQVRHLEQPLDAPGSRSRLHRESDDENPHAGDDAYHDGSSSSSSSSNEGSENESGTDDGITLRRRRNPTRSGRGERLHLIHGSDEDDDGGEGGGEDGAGAAATATTTSHPVLFRHWKRLDASWVQRVVANPLVFVPQPGDHIVYFPQGHAEYLIRFPTLATPPWQKWDLTRRPFVLCHVQDVDYVYPEGEVVNQEGKYVVPCLCVLKVVGEPVFVGNAATGDFTPVHDDDEFVVTYQYSDVPDFCVLQSRFVQGLRLQLTIGDEVKVPLLERDAETGELLPDMFDATIHSFNLDGAGGKFKGSPWESICVVYSPNVDGPIQRISPWEICLEDVTPYPWMAVPLLQGVDLDFRSGRATGSSILKRDVLAHAIETLPEFPSFSVAAHLRKKQLCNVDASLICARLKSEDGFYRSVLAFRKDLERMETTFSAGRHAGHALCVLVRGFIVNIVDKAIELGLMETPSHMEEEEEIFVSREKFVACMSACLDKIRLMDPPPESFFAKPVSRAQPGYYNIIMCPMDFHTMSTKLTGRGYDFDLPVDDHVKSNPAFLPQITMWSPSPVMTIKAAREMFSLVLKDFDLISRNAMIYNDPALPVHHRAVAVKNEVDRVIRHLDLIKECGVTKEQADELLEAVEVTDHDNAEHVRKVSHHKKATPRHDSDDEEKVMMKTVQTRFGRVITRPSYVVRGSSDEGEEEDDDDMPHQPSLRSSRRRVDDEVMTHEDMESKRAQSRHDRAMRAATRGGENTLEEPSSTAAAATRRRPSARGIENEPAPSSSLDIGNARSKRKMTTIEDEVESNPPAKRTRSSVNNDHVASSMVHDGDDDKEERVLRTRSSKRVVVQPSSPLRPVSKRTSSLRDRKRAVSSEEEEDDDDDDSHDDELKWAARTQVSLRPRRSSHHASVSPVPTRMTRKGREY